MYVCMKSTVQYLLRYLKKKTNEDLEKNDKFSMF